MTARAIKYRPDIDGLRAIAVLSVLGYHAGFTTTLSGGFVGVDVFFVISGYLITQILFRTMSDGTYSLVDFYAKRTIRIFPALFAMYLAIMIAAFFVLFPSEIMEVSRSIVSSSLFFSNIYFFTSSSYFSEIMERNPLLHTWSLSVEEQFYLLFPLVLWPLLRLPRIARIYAIAGLATLSFVLAAWLVFSEPSAMFYLTPFRAWELMLGSLVAIAPIPKPTRPWVAQVLGVAGLVMIAASVVLLTRNSVFPGVSALPACLGAALLIYTGSGAPNVSAGFLSLPPMRFVGLISYSLYLWHWPIIVFARGMHNFSSLPERLFLIAVCLVVAILSWAMIEQPIRRSSAVKYPRRVIVIGTVGILACCAMALTLPAVHRGLADTPAEAERLLAYEVHDTPGYMRPGSCFLTSSFRKFEDYDKDACLSEISDRPAYLLLGDSHAAHLWDGLASVYPDINVMQATASGCKPVLNPVGEPRCTRMVDYVLEEFLPKRPVDTIILSARWGRDDVAAAVAAAGRLTASARRVIIIGPVPEYSMSVPRILAKAVASGESPDRAAAEYERTGPHAVDQLFADTPLPAGVEYRSALKVMTEGGCRLMAGRAPAQFDYGHLSQEGSACVARGLHLQARQASDR